MNDRTRFFIPTAIGVIGLFVVLVLFLKAVVSHRRPTMMRTGAPTTQQVNLSKSTGELEVSLPKPTGKVDDTISAVLNETKTDESVNKSTDSQAQAVSNDSDVTDGFGQSIDEKQL